MPSAPPRVIRASFPCVPGSWRTCISQWTCWRRRRRWTGRDELDPKRYGIIVRTDDGRQALLLPDLEGVDTVEQQVDITCRKGGIDPQHDLYRIQRFEVTRHG